MVKRCQVMHDDNHQCENNAEIFYTCVVGTDDDKEYTEDIYVCHYHLPMFTSMLQNQKELEKLK